MVCLSFASFVFRDANPLSPLLRSPTRLSVVLERMVFRPLLTLREGTGHDAAAIARLHAGELAFGISRNAFGRIFRPSVHHERALCGSSDFQSRRRTIFAILAETEMELAGSRVLFRTSINQPTARTWIISRRAATYRSGISADASLRP